MTAASTLECRTLALSRPLSLIHAHAQVENLCRERALKAFGLDAAQWGVNVQVHAFLGSLLF